MSHSKLAASGELVHPPASDEGTVRHGAMCPSVMARAPPATTGSSDGEGRVFGTG